MARRPCWWQLTYFSSPPELVSVSPSSLRRTTGQNPRDIKDALSNRVPSIYPRAVTAGALRASGGQKPADVTRRSRVQSCEIFEVSFPVFCASRRCCFCRWILQIFDKSRDQKTRAHGSSDNLAESWIDRCPHSCRSGITADGGSKLQSTRFVSPGLSQLRDPAIHNIAMPQKASRAADKIIEKW